MVAYISAALSDIDTELYGEMHGQPRTPNRSKQRERFILLLS